MFVIYLQGSAQSWKETHLTNVIYLPITSMEAHQNNLYATVFNGFTGVLSKLNADRISWTSISTGDITVPRFLADAKTRLYLSSINSGVFSMLYYSTDQGATFKADTAGLPPYLTGVSLIAGLQYFNGKVIVNMGAGGYFIKDTSELKWRAIPVVTALNGGVDPLTCMKDTLYAFDNTGTRTFYFSSDWGTTWNVRTTDFPADFGTNKFAVDESLGRIYAAGAWNGLTQAGLYYSDNGGNNWTLMNLSSFLGTMPNNNPQQVTAVYSDGPKLFIALENRKANTAPDVISSSNGINGLAYDTLGLPPLAASGVYGVKFLKYADQVALSLVVIDVYLKGNANGIFETSMNRTFKAYPNPANQSIQIDEAQFINWSSIRIVDTQGKVVFFSSKYENEINIEKLKVGLYHMLITDTDGQISTSKFIKE